MRRTTAALLPCALILACASAAVAAEPAAGPTYNIMGPSSCAGWPKRGRIESAGKAVPLNWMLGFISGQADRADPRLFELIDPDKIAVWLDTYCQANPSATLPSAGRALITELAGQLPPLAPARGDSSPMFIAPVAPPPVAAEPARQTAAAHPAAQKPAATKHPAARPRRAVAARPEAKPAPVAARPPAAPPVLRPAVPRAAPPAPPRAPAARPAPAPARPANPFTWPFFKPRPPGS